MGETKQIKIDSVRLFKLNTNVKTLNTDKARRTFSHLNAL